MTGAELYTYILRKFIRTDKETEAYQAMSDIIADMKYLAQLEVVKEEAYIVGITTLGEYRIAVPSDFGNLIGEITLYDVDNEDPRTLKTISKLEYDRLYGDRLAAAVGDMDTAIPRHACVYGGQIFVGPVPDAITYKYQINYTTDDTSEIASGTTSVPFTSNYHERNILRMGVLAELYDGMENFEEANYWRALYTVKKEELEQRDNRNIEDELSIQYRGI